MTNIIGIPSELLFSIIGFLAMSLGLSERNTLREKIKEAHDKIKAIENSAKDHKKELETSIEKAIKNAINSREFRDDVKTTVRESMLHFEANRSKGEACTYSHFEQLLHEIKETLNHKLTNI